MAGSGGVQVYEIVIIIVQLLRWTPLIDQSCTYIKSTVAIHNQGIRVS
jgi:hypothetical protein